MVRTCCICEQEFKEYPNSPYPFDGDECCAECDNRFVTPIRIIYKNVGYVGVPFQLLKLVAKYGMMTSKAKELANQIVSSLLEK